jgi:hypothetical protein
MVLSRKLLKMAGDLSGKVTVSVQAARSIALSAGA